MAFAVPKPEDRLAFAAELAQVRAKDVKNKYKKELNELEIEYQFILLRSLDSLSQRDASGQVARYGFTTIKEKLCDTAGVSILLSHQPPFHQLELEHQDMPPLSQEFKLETHDRLQTSSAARTVRRP